jgi:hypothetical protein
LRLYLAVTGRGDDRQVPKESIGGRGDLVDRSLEDGLVGA